MSPSVTRFGDDVRNLDARPPACPGIGREDPDLGRGERVREVVLERRDASHLGAGRELQLVAGDARARHLADHGRLDRRSGASVSTSVSAIRSAAVAGWPLCGRERRRSARSGSRYSPGGAGPSKRRSCELSTELSAGSSRGKAARRRPDPVVLRLPGAGRAAGAATPATERRRRRRNDVRELRLAVDGSRVGAGPAAARRGRLDGRRGVAGSPGRVPRDVARRRARTGAAIAPADAPVTRRQPPRNGEARRGCVTPTPPMRACERRCTARPPRTPPYSCRRSRSNEVERRPRRDRARSGLPPNASRTAIDERR